MGNQVKIAYINKWTPGGDVTANFYSGAFAFTQGTILDWDFQIDNNIEMVQPMQNNLTLPRFWNRVPRTVILNAAFDSISDMQTQLGFYHNSYKKLMALCLGDSIWLKVIPKSHHESKQGTSAETIHSQLQFQMVDPFIYECKAASQIAQGDGGTVSTGSGTTRTWGELLSTIGSNPAHGTTWSPCMVYVVGNSANNITAVEFGINTAIDGSGTVIMKAAKSGLSIATGTGIWCFPTVPELNKNVSHRVLAAQMFTGATEATCTKLANSFMTITNHYPLMYYDATDYNYYFYVKVTQSGSWAGTVDAAVYWFRAWG